MKIHALSGPATLRGPYRGPVRSLRGPSQSAVVTGLLAAAGGYLALIAFLAYQESGGARRRRRGARANDTRLY